MPDLPTWVWITMFSIVDSIVWSFIMRRAVAKRDAELRDVISGRIDELRYHVRDLGLWDPLLHEIRSGQQIAPRAAEGK